MTFFMRTIAAVAIALLCAVSACTVSDSFSPLPLRPSPGPASVARTIPAPLPVKAGPPPWWTPGLDNSFQWQLSGMPLDQSVEAAVYDVDLFDTDPEVIAALHARNRKVVCYLSAGSVEDWRPDAALIPHEVIGRDYEHWEGERWLDIRAIGKLAPVLRARLDMCKAKGFDGVEADNVDGYQNKTGFRLSEEDQLQFNRWLANEAHRRGLSIGLKNDADQAISLVDSFDWALTESCYKEHWCDQMSVFASAGKPVFMVEYTDEMKTQRFRGEACQRAAGLHFQAVLKNRGLDAFRVGCVH